MGDQTVVVTGAEGFAVAGGRTMPLPSAALERQTRGMARDLRILVRYASDPSLEAVAAGEDTVDGVKCQVVAVTYKGAESRLCVAPDGKVLKQSYQGEHPTTRAPAQIEVYYSDYRDVEGRMVPHKEVIKADGQEAVSLTLESFKVNPPVDDKLFEKPAA